MKISVIIPTYNRADLLQQTLASVARQKADQSNFEVIVVDNGSTDTTAAVCENFKAQIQNLLYVFDDMPGQLTGRHRGLQESGSELLAYIDDDVILDDSWLSSVLTITTDHPEVSIFGGPSVPEYQAAQPEWLSALFENTPYGGKMCLPLSLIDIGKDMVLVDPVYVFGLNFIIRKSVLENLKGFHPDVIPASLQRFQGDGETGLSIKAGMDNLKAIHSSSLKLKHQIPAERLTQEFFNKWSFYNGVCKSFTDLRYRFNLYTPPAETTPSLKRVKTIFKRISNSFAGILRTSEVKKWAEVFDQLTDNYNAGYKFHQRAFLQDPLVKEWVLKKDYLNYTLPTIDTRETAL